MTTIYAAHERGMLAIHGDNGRWTVTTQLADKHPQCVACDPAHPERVYCGTLKEGLWCSDDAGATWRPVGPGIAHSMVMAVVVSALEQANGYGVVYAGTEPSALYRSDDGGATWRELPSLLDLPSKATWSFPPRPYTHHVRWITLDPHEPATIYVCIEAGALVRSFDGGRTWDDRHADTPWDTHKLAVHPAAPGRLYSAAGDGFSQPGRGYNESRDHATSWQRPDEGLRQHYLWSVAVDPGDAETIVVAASPSPHTAHNPTAAESHLYHSAAGGPWEEVCTGLPEARGALTYVLATNTAEPGVFYALGNHGLYRSPDAGVNWQRLDVPWPDHLRFSHPEGLAVVSA
jgi:hypothetical protein